MGVLQPFIVGEDGPEDVGQWIVYLWQILQRGIGDPKPPLLNGLFTRLEQIRALLIQIEENTRPPV